MRAPRLSTQAAIIGAGRLLNMAAAAGTLIVLARVIPDKQSYGAICQVIVLYMLLSQIFALGLPQSTYYFLPRFAPGEQRGFLTQTIALLMLSGAVLGLGLFLGAEVIGRLMHSPLLPGLLRIFALYPLFMLPTLAVEGALLHAGRPTDTVIFNALVRMGMFCGLVIPTLYQFSLERTVAIWVGVGALMFILALILMFSTVRGQPLIWKPSMLREEWHFAIPLGLSTLIAVSGTYLDRLMVSYSFGTEAFGVYTNASVEVPTVTMVTNATGVVLMAEFSRRTSAGDRASIIPTWHSAMIKSAVIVFASFGFLAFWSHETMRVLFSDRFADSGAIFGIYAWMIPTMIFTAHSLFIAEGATRPMVILNVIGLAIELVCVMAFGWLFGLPGIALGAVLARYLGGGIGMHWYVRKITSIGWRAFLPWKNLGLAFLVALAAGAASRLIYLKAPSSMIFVFIAGLSIFLGLYILGLHFTKLLPYVVPRRWRLSMNRREVAV